MLVSSIGYFNVNKTVVPANVIKNQNSRVNLSEGFGHYNEKNNSTNNNSGFLNSVFDSVKASITKNKTDESSKYLSLIA